jgi:glycosyltransferase involved in cell wall biosynthesis
MNILYVLPYFNPKRGGDVNVCTNLARGFVALGHNVTILTTDFELDKQYIQSLRSSGIEVSYFKCSFHVGLFLYSPNMKKWLENNIKNFDVVHLHTFRAYQNNIVTYYSKKFNVPYILQAHGSVLPFFQKQGLKRIYDHVWGYKILDDSSKLIALTQTEYEQYKEMGAEESKIEILPNGIDIREYQDIPERGEFRNKHSIKDYEKIILYLGRLNGSKGIELLINAFYKLSTELTNVKLVIVGPDDGFLSYIKNLINDLEIRDKVLLTGPLYHKDKMEAYVDADVFVTPRFSGFPVTFLESCACKLPIITTKNGDDLNWIDGNVGFVTEYNENSLKKAMLKLLLDDSLNEKFGLNGLKLIESKFNWEDIIKDLERLYKQIIYK